MPYTSRTCAAVTAVGSWSGPRRTASSSAVHELRPVSSAATTEGYDEVRLANPDSPVVGFLERVSRYLISTSPAEVSWPGSTVLSAALSITACAGTPVTERARLQALTSPTNT